MTFGQVIESYRFNLSKYPTAIFQNTRIKNL